MNDKNFEFLQDQLKNMGFGDKLNLELENVIRSASPDFQLKTDATFYNNKVQATLYFRKGDQNEMYFFNKYDATLKNEDPDKEKTQIFYINQNRGVTFKEAFNLLEGRAVNKELTNLYAQKYNAWIQLNFDSRDKNNNHEVKQYHQNYGFDLEKVLDKHPIRELENPDDRKMLLGSLKRGNLQLVDYEKDGTRQKMFIEANPKARSINLYDKDKNLVIVASVSQDKKKELSKDKQEVKEIKQEPKKEKTKSRSKDELDTEGLSQKVTRR